MPPHPPARPPQAAAAGVVGRARGASLAVTNVAQSAAGDPSAQALQTSPAAPSPAAPNPVPAAAPSFKANVAGAAAASGPSFKLLAAAAPARQPSSSSAPIALPPARAMSLGQASSSEVASPLLTRAPSSLVLTRSATVDVLPPPPPPSWEGPQASSTAAAAVAQGITLPASTGIHSVPAVAGPGLSNDSRDFEVPSAAIDTAQLLPPLDSAGAACATAEAPPSLPEPCAGSAAGDVEMRGDLAAPGHSKADSPDASADPTSAAAPLVPEPPVASPPPPTQEAAAACAQQPQPQHWGATFGLLLPPAVSRLDALHGALGPAAAATLPTNPLNSWYLTGGVPSFARTAPLAVPAAPVVGDVPPPPPARLPFRQQQHPVAGVGGLWGGAPLVTEVRDLLTAESSAAANFTARLLALMRAGMTTAPTPALPAVRR